MVMTLWGIIVITAIVGFLVGTFGPHNMRQTALIVGGTATAVAVLLVLGFAKGSL